MPFVDIAKIAGAIESLQRFHAFFGVTYLSMKKEGVVVGPPIAWGSTQEMDLLDTYYRPPGARPGKPYFVPLGRPDEDHGFWKNPKFSAGSLQRARTTDRFRPALDHPNRTDWAFEPGYMDVLVAQLPKTDGGQPIRLPVLDLVAWMYRDRDLPHDLDEVVGLFREEFNLQDDTEFDQLFEPPAAGSEAQFFHESPPDRNALIEIVGGIPEGPAIGEMTETQIIESIEEHIAKRALLSLPPGFVRNFYYALKTQRFVVLAGRPGTGKTAFARAFSSALGEVFPDTVNELIVSVGQDFGEPDVIGYEKIAGGLAPTELSRTLFLSGRVRDLYVVVLDEMNLAQVDYYLARILPAIESDAPVELPGLDARYELPPDALFVGTINSYIEETTRVPLSGPVKRRANVIRMPNTLELVIRSGDRDGFRKMVEHLLRQTQERCQKRAAGALPSVLDGFRAKDMEDALAPASPILDGDFCDVLWGICQACSKSPQTSMTLGVLQDMVDYVAMAHWEAPYQGLDLQIAQKLAPQLAGPADVVRELVGLLEGLEKEDVKFESALEALRELLDSEDPSSGLVFYRY